MAKAFPELISEIDGLIRAGSANAARRKLGALKHVKVPRASALALASLARRANVPGLALRLLNPIVRPSAKKLGAATEPERAEYAASLIRVGAVREALDILKALDGDRHPEALLFEAFALMTQWRYDATIPLLERYVAAPGLDDYRRLVGKVNLAAALVQERLHEPARARLEELRGETSRLGLALLHGNALELSAQQAVFAGHWRDAARYLTAAEETLKDTGGLDELFVRKWKAIVALLRDGDAASRAAVALVREEAEGRRHWETVRECDFFRAIRTRDEKLAVHLYFGTPYGSYRARIVTELGGTLSIPDCYAWDLTERAGPGDRRERRPELTYLLGHDVVAEEPLKVGQALHRLLAILASDFYRPRRVATLHTELYPTEFFNPLSSPNRVHRVVHRLKEWLDSAGAPIAVTEDDGMYRLRALRPCRLVIPLEKAGARRGHLLERIRARCEGDDFTAADVIRWLGVSGRSAQRLLLDGVRDGALEREGAAAATRYRFPVAVKNTRRVVAK